MLEYKQFQGFTILPSITFQSALHLHEDSEIRSSYTVLHFNKVSSNLNKKQTEDVKQRIVFSQLYIIKRGLDGRKN